MAKFEFIEKFAAAGINLPERKTKGAAGYDFEVAEDIMVPSIHKHKDKMKSSYPSYGVTYSLDDMAMMTKTLGTKPTLVPTGIKCKLDPDTYLELSVRSSCPLKYWLIMGNSVGIIDSDYYNNPDNEGHIYFQVINLSPFDIQLKKGDIIGQGIIKPYLTTEDDCANGARKGGFGSTNV